MRAMHPTLKAKHKVKHSTLSKADTMLCFALTMLCFQGVKRSIVRAKCSMLCSLHIRVKHTML